VAVRAIILRFLFLPVSPVKLEEMVTDLAHELSPLFAVVVVEIAMGRAAADTGGMFRYLERGCTVFNRRQGLAVFCLVFCKEVLVILRCNDRFRLGRLGQRCEGINGKVSVIGVLLLEVISGFYFRIAVLEDIQETIDNLHYLAPCELRAYPDDEAGYSVHKGLPPCGVATAFSPISEGEASRFKREKMRRLYDSESYPQPRLPCFRRAAGTAMDNSYGGERSSFLLTR